MNYYRVTNLYTGEVIEGNCFDLERKCYNSESIRLAAKNHRNYYHYRCEIIPEPPKTKQKKKVKKESLEEVARKANALGISYGKYVAMNEKWRGD